VVARRDDTRHDDCVDETSSNFAPGHHENNRKWRGVAVLRGQTVVRVGYVQPDDQDRENVEYQDPPEDVSHHTRQRLRWVLGLSGGDGNTLGAAVCERGCYEDRCEAADAADEWRVSDVPILRADVLAGGITAAVDGDAEYDEDLDKIVSLSPLW